MLPYFVLDLLFVSTVPPFKRSRGFSNILSFTSDASSQIDNEGTFTVKVLVDRVNFLYI